MEGGCIELHGIAESADQRDSIKWVGDNVRQSKSGPGLILSELVSRVRSKLAFLRAVLPGFLTRLLLRFLKL